MNLSKYLVNTYCQTGRKYFLRMKRSVFLKSNTWCFPDGGHPPQSAQLVVQRVRHFVCRGSAVGGFDVKTGLGGAFHERQMPICKGNEWVQLTVDLLLILLMSSSLLSAYQHLKASPCFSLWVWGINLHHYLLTSLSFRCWIHELRVVTSTSGTHP